MAPKLKVNHFKCFVVINIPTEILTWGINQSKTCHMTNMNENDEFVQISLQPDQI